MKKRSHKCILKKYGPNIEYCGTPDIISFQDLHSLPVLVLRKWRDKQSSYQFKWITMGAIDPEICNK